MKQLMMFFQNQTLKILNEVWRFAVKMTELEHYIFLVEIYIEFTLKCCSEKEVNSLLGDLIKHITPDRAFENHQSQLQAILEKILLNISDFSKILTMDNFIPFLDVFTGPSQIDVGKAVLRSFSTYSGQTADPVLLNMIFEIGKNVHDSINSLTFTDEVRQISRMLSAFIYKVDFGRDVEKQLNFYVDCRAAFGNIDVVKKTLILGVCNLAMKTHSIVNGKHNKKTSAFIRACIAYCFITIPTMDDGLTRLNLYLLAGQVALFNRSIPQAESLFKAAITLIPDVPNIQETDLQVKSNEDGLISFVQNFASTLIYAPGHPTRGAFYLIKPLIQVLNEYTWEKGSSAKARCNLSFIFMLAALHQAKPPYSLTNVESNYEMFGGDAEYKAEIEATIDKCLIETVAEINRLTSESDISSKKTQSLLAVQLINETVCLAKLSEKTKGLVGEMFAIAKGNTPSPQLNSTIAYFALLSKSRPSAPISNDWLKQLAR